MRQRWHSVRIATVSAAVTALLLAALGSFNFARSWVVSAPPALAATLGSHGASMADVAERALPSVVSILSKRRVKGEGGAFPFQHPFFREFFGRREAPEETQQGLGSGVVVNVDGRTVIVTNNHVVSKADELKVTLSNRELDVKVIGTDPKSDLAVLDVKGAKDLHPIAVGDSGALRLGDVVLAVGNMFGLTQTVTMGIVSAKGRANLRLLDYEDFIQTDAAINPGNSGGALINMQGQLVGINTAILSRSGGYQGIGFAIPTAMAMPIVKSLITSGRVVRGYLGVMIQDVDADLARAMNLPHTNGVLISDVVPDGPGAKAGIQRGDFVLSIEGKPVDSMTKLRNLIASYGAKRTVTLQLLRKGQRKTIKARLGELPGGEVAEAGEQAERRMAGLQLGELTPELRRRLEIPSRISGGVVVQGVVAGSPAAEAGIRPGDVILEANRVNIDSVGRFTDVYAKARQRVLLLLYRQGATLFLTLPK